MAALSRCVLLLGALALAAQGSSLTGLQRQAAPKTAAATFGRRRLATSTLLNTRRQSPVLDQPAAATNVKSSLLSGDVKPQNKLRESPLGKIRTVSKKLATKAIGARPATSGPRYTSYDWFKNLRSLLFLKSDILKRISSHLLFNIVVAALGAAWFHYYPETFFNPGAIGHTLSGAALSLMLVFRTNSAYDRFWEARKILGAVVDNSRGLARIAPTALPPQAAADFGRMLVTFPYMLRIHLTGRGQQKVRDTSDAPDVVPFMDENQIRTVDSYFSKPFATLSMMNKILDSQQAKYPGEDPAKTLEMLPQRQILQRNVNLLAANTGACERIQGCPVPLSYSRHLSRYLTIWSATLPFVLAPLLGWYSIPVITLICWSLFSIEEVGHMIEEPFFALPYDQVQTKRVADVIKRDTVAMYKQQLGVDLATRQFQPVPPHEQYAPVAVPAS
eukprot:CAMPEP_0114516352 /NCGR_PEP_ID=MMETSP0109-20121206/17279_1 /TAXON_ID=29199 /ORGANISM="Chlorarachnion reptans, Strain CCCM449" /LENGTH=445 /DNA_ID=CAMNT_0001696729 /DNA_START=26 /DNA_END=1363 /DNA_ORIENTATION=+